MDESLLQANLDNVKYIVDTVGHTAQADQNPIDIKFDIDRDRKNYRFIEDLHSPKN